MSKISLVEAAQQALEALEYGQHTLKQISESQWESRGQLAMDALKAALAEPQSTHSTECYKWHHKCAVAEVERLRAKLEGPTFEVNFCARCGKRTRDVHSCTPPPKL